MTTSLSSSAGFRNQILTSRVDPFMGTLRQETAWILCFAQKRSLWNGRWRSGTLKRGLSVSPSPGCGEERFRTTSTGMATTVQSSMLASFLNLRIVTRSRACPCYPWLPDGYSQILRSYVFAPSGFWTMAPLRYAAKFYSILSLDCAPMPSALAQSKERKGSNFAA